MRDASRISVTHSEIKFKALKDFLEEHREEMDKKAKCYRLPVTKISKSFRIAGDKIGNTLRSQAEFCSLHPDQLATVPWIDFLAVGQVTVAETSVPWMIFLTSDAFRASAALSSGVDNRAGRSSASEPERCNLFTRVIHELRKFSASDFLIPIADVQNLIGPHQTQANGSDGSGIVDPPPELLLIWIGHNREICANAFKELNIQNQASLRSFDEFESLAKSGLLNVFGTGWFGMIDTFLGELLRLSKSRGANSTVVQAPPLTTRSSPQCLAAAGTRKLVSFGWLPHQWNNRDFIIKNAGNSSTRKNLLAQLYDDGIRVFPLPKMEIPNEGPLSLRNTEQLKNDTWLNFESTHATDKAVIIIEMTAYGKRENPNCLDLAPASLDHFFALPVRLSTLGALGRLLPVVRTEVIGYTPGSAGTCKSGSVEDLIELFHSSPSDPCLREHLKKMVRWICHPATYSSFDFMSFNKLREIKCKLANQDVDGTFSQSGNIRPELVTIFSNSITDLIEICASGQDDNGRAFVDAFGILMAIIEVNMVDFRDLLNAKSLTDLDLYRQFDDLESVLGSLGETWGGIRLTGDSECSPSILREGIGQFLLLVRHGRIGLPDVISKWINDNFKVFWLAPLDHMEPVTDKIREGPMTFPGSWSAHLHYPKLFSINQHPDVVDARICNLLKCFPTSMAAKTNANGRSWLINRISETNEMMTGLMSGIGYVPDFGLHRLPFHFKPKNENILAMILNLDTRLIVRSLLATEEGDKALHKWRDALVSETRESRFFRIDSITDPFRKEFLENQFDVFFDARGLAVAAFDCFRFALLQKLKMEKNPSIEECRVFFSPEEFLRNYRPRFFARSHDSAYDDNIKNRKTTGSIDYADYLFSDTRSKLYRELRSESFNLISAVDLAEELHQKEGLGFGEPIMSCLDDLRDELLDTNPPPVVEANLMKLMEHFRPGH